MTTQMVINRPDRECAKQTPSHCSWWLSSNDVADEANAGGSLPIRTSTSQAQVTLLSNTYRTKTNKIYISRHSRKLPRGIRHVELSPRDRAKKHWGILAIDRWASRTVCSFEVFSLVLMGPIYHRPGVKHIIRLIWFLHCGGEHKQSSCHLLDGFRHTNH